VERRQVLGLRQRLEDAARQRHEDDRGEDLRNGHGDVAAGVQYELDEHGSHLLQVVPDARHPRETDAIRCSTHHPPTRTARSVSHVINYAVLYHAGSAFDNRVTLTFDLLTSGSTHAEPMS